MRTQQFIILASAALLASSTAAQQTVTFSLSSDDDSNAPTFEGSGNSLRDAGSDRAFSLEVDDNNGPLPTLGFNDLSFAADFELTSLGATSVAPGIFTHQYLVDGTFSFDSDQGSLLSANVSGGVLVVLGTENAWFTAGALVASDIEGAEVEYTWLGGDLAAYGLFNGVTSLQDATDDGVFTLSVIFGDNGGAGVALGSDGLPSAGYTAEASFSGSATFIPAPGTLALLAGAGGLASRRRRR